MGKRYPMLDQQTGYGSTVLQCDRVSNTPVGVRPPLPGAVIVVHGVNDVGVSYDAVEQGLCAGLHRRMGWDKRWFLPARYRMPLPEDNDKLEADPDAVFFKRAVDKDTYSPVIPFYWGYREVTRKAQEATEAATHGQCVDRYQNRLDKDMSKGGGPFANATTTLPDMWNTGAPKGGGLAERVKNDPYRPIREGPGRMYMILAAQRLAALIGMIQDYDEHDVISIVAHSQGCLVSLLAQAFVLQRGQRPADTLILNNPPYGLHETAGEAVAQWASRSNFAAIGGGRDAAMIDHYAALDAQQTMAARVDTLARIVNGIRLHGSKAPWTLKDAEAARRCGLVGSGWDKPEAPSTVKERDNRGKVYLYFSPEDMTVALTNIQGIGWQGVPYEIQRRGAYSAELPLGVVPALISLATVTRRRPLEELGKGFFQRVFTLKSRWQVGAGQGTGLETEKVGWKPHRFELRRPDEKDHDHILPSEDGMAVEHLPKGEEREISGEELPLPFEPQLKAHTQTDGKEQAVDQIDAATAVTSPSDLAILDVWQLIDDPKPEPGAPMIEMVSPHPALHSGYVGEMPQRVRSMQLQFNQTPSGIEKDKADQTTVLNVYTCLGSGSPSSARQIAKLLVQRKETANEARLRHQHAISANSFHSAIFGGALNHERSTSYDLAVGGGNAASHPLFYAYLCAVADWRLKQPVKTIRTRPGILTWPIFQSAFAPYWNCESPERKRIIEGNCEYYSSGILPRLPLPIPGELPPTVVCETVHGTVVAHTTSTETNPTPRAGDPSVQALQPGSKP